MTALPSENQLAACGRETLRPSSAGCRRGGALSHDFAEVFKFSFRRRFLPQWERFNVYLCHERCNLRAAFNPQTSSDPKGFQLGPERFLEDRFLKNRPRTPHDALQLSAGIRGVERFGRIKRAIFARV